MNAQGEDVVSGVRTPLDISQMKELMPDAHAQLIEIMRALEAHYKDMQDVEFTVEERSPLHAPDAQREAPGAGRGRFAVDAVAEGLLTREEALVTIDATRLDALLHPTFDPDGAVRRARHGRERLARRREGRDRVHRRGSGGGRGRRGVT